MSIIRRLTRDGAGLYDEPAMSDPSRAVLNVSFGHTAHDTAGS